MSAPRPAVPAGTPHGERAKSAAAGSSTSVGVGGGLGPGKQIDHERMAFLGDASSLLVRGHAAFLDDDSAAHGGVNRPGSSEATGIASGARRRVSATDDMDGPYSGLGRRTTHTPPRVVNLVGSMPNYHGFPTSALPPLPPAPPLLSQMNHGNGFGRDRPRFQEQEMPPPAQEDQDEYSVSGPSPRCQR